MLEKQSIFHQLPDASLDEQFEDILKTPGIRIERIVSQGQSSAPDSWYDQAQAEWVMVLQGEAVLAFADGREITLTAGEYINLPVHCLHRVAYTKPDEPTIWLAVFYDAEV